MQTYNRTKTIIDKLARTLRNQAFRRARKGTNEINDFNDFHYQTSFLNQDVLDRIAENIRSRVIERTLSGLDYRGRPFIPYTPEYAKRKGVGIYDVNLQLSGEMLDDFKVEVYLRPEFTIGEIFYIDLDYLSIHYGFWTDTAEERYYYNANNQYGNDRDFLGVQQGRPLLPMGELLKIIQQSLREVHKR